MELCDNMERAPEIISDVRESWPLVERNAFDPDGNGHPNLSINLLIEVSRDNSAPCHATYLLQELKRSPNGVIRGTIVPTNRDYPAFFFKEITVDPMLIVDWHFELDSGGPHYGDYQRRHLSKNTNNSGLTGMLSPMPVPPNWR